MSSARTKVTPSREATGRGAEKSAEPKSCSGISLGFGENRLKRMAWVYRRGQRRQEAWKMEGRWFLGCGWVEMIDLLTLRHFIYWCRLIHRYCSKFVFGLQYICPLIA